MKELLRKNWEYKLSQDEKGELILVVVCGTVATYDLKIQLDEKEKEAFEKQGVVFLEKLVEDIRTYPSRYEFRSLK